MPFSSTDPVLQSDSTRAVQWARIDLLLLLLLTLCCGIVTYKDIHLSYTPVEDAAMLLRYSLHLAQGHGIRWNIQDPPVDGATDFLYMVMTAALARGAHIGVIAASRVLNVSAYFLSVLLVYGGSRRAFGSPRWLSFAAAFYLVGGPAVKMASACFGAPVFGCAALICWYFATRYMEGERNWLVAVSFGLTGLVTGLVRPEGVFLAGFFLLGLVYFCGWRSSVKAVTAFALIFAVLGGGYFFWHWHYFGYPLPNPFYLKGDGHLYPHSMIQSMVNVSLMLAPVLPLLPLGFLYKRSLRRTVAVLIPAVCFTCVWVLLNDWNNHFMRFQYAIVPVVLLSVPGLLMDLPKGISLPKWETLHGLQRAALRVALGFALVVAVGYFDRIIPYISAGDGMRTFALRLAPYAGKGYTMAVTEAGQLPLYSDWRVIDGLGLNDAWLAHHGERLTEEYLDRSKPEIIMVHASFPGSAESMKAMLYGDLDHAGPVYNQAMMSAYARDHNYILAAAFSPNACNYHLYYVRRDFPDSDAIVSLIRDNPYYFLDSGLETRDVRENMLPAAFPCFVS